MIQGVDYYDNFYTEDKILFDNLLKNVNWDERMKNRKTASFGVAYNYSQIHYPYQKMLPALMRICKQIEQQIGFLPNNCLINLYLDGKSKMGYHSDQTDILAPNTGVAILSLGLTRSLRYRNINNKEEKIDYPLASGSLLYMTQEVQNIWQHAIPKSNIDQPRMSLTFRKIVS